MSRISPKKVQSKLLHGASVVRHIAGNPEEARILVRDRCGAKEPLRDWSEHIDGALGWLLRAHDACGGGGVSWGWRLGRGWAAAYPETTGYIIETLVELAQRRGDGELQRRAVAMGDWEVEVALPDGSVRGRTMDDLAQPVVFNTGQVLFGWLSLARTDGDARWFAAIERAADWLVAAMDPDGTWRRHTYAESVTTYHTRVAWPLLMAAELMDRDDWRAAGARHIAWAVGLSDERGHVKQMGFGAESEAFVHTISYTLRGLLEGGRLLGGEPGEAAIDVARRASERLLRRLEVGKPAANAEPNMLAGRLDARWRPAADFSCLTGSVQLARIFTELWRLDGDDRLLNGALRLCDQVARTQRLDTDHPGLRGAIAGSYPLTGDYIRLAWPNWAAKFFIDALVHTDDAVKTREIAVAAAAESPR